MIWKHRKELVPEKGEIRSPDNASPFGEVVWKPMDFAPDYFFEVRELFLKKKKRQVMGGRHDDLRSQESDIPVQNASHALVRRVCDYEFIMGFAGRDEPDVVSHSRPSRDLMRDYNFLPLGKAFDETLENDAIHVLVGQLKPLRRSPPYLLKDVFNSLLVVLGIHYDRCPRLVLLFTDPNVCKRVINRFFFSVVEDDESISLESLNEPMAIDPDPSDPPHVRQLKIWLEDAINRQASDMHLEPLEDRQDDLGEGDDFQGQVEMNVRGRARFRVTSNLEEDSVRTNQLDLKRMINYIKTYAPPMDITKTRVPQDGRLKLIGRRLKTPIDVRLSTMPTVHGEKVALRLLNPELLQETAARGIEGVIHDTSMSRKFGEALISPHGIVLVTGPTGSGKSTTLNAAIHHLLRHHKNAKNIVTIEDPVEYNVHGANQLEVNEKAGIGFSNALRHILRQDPDIILVGEIRDEMTARYAIEAAMTGHLILTTLHTNDALQSVQRLGGFGISPSLISANVRLFQAQRLVRMLCRTCRKPLEPEEISRKLKTGSLSGYRDAMFRPGMTTVFEEASGGCPACNLVGYKGRRAVMEIAIVDKPLEAAIEEGAPIETLRKIAGTSGYKPMIEHGIDLIREGVTSINEIQLLSMQIESVEESILSEAEGEHA